MNALNARLLYLLVLQSFRGTFDALRVKNTELEYNDDGVILSERWYLNNLLHNESGPSVRLYYNNGTPKLEEWHIKGQKHRDKDPSQSYYNEDGTISMNVWHQFGSRHREDGPAVLYFGEDGEVIVSEYYLEGRRILSLDDMKARVKKLRRIKKGS